METAPEEIQPEEMIPPEITTPLRSQNVMDGDSVTFQVTFIGYPNPGITWFHNDREIISSTDFVITVDYERMESTLIIPEVFPEDQGIYKVVATNPSGIAETTSKLVIISKYLLRNVSFL